MLDMLANIAVWYIGVALAYSVREVYYGRDGRSAVWTTTCVPALAFSAWYVLNG